MTYLQKVAVHESIRKREAAFRQQNIQLQLDEHSYNIAESTERFLPETHFQNKESKAELLQIFQSLPKRQWEMIYMYYYAQFSTKEIAQMLRCTVNHVHKTMHIARQTLKVKLEGTKISAKGVLLLPLSAIFTLEEEAFAATYTAPPFTGFAESAGQVLTAASKSATAYIIAGCATVGIVATVLYFALSAPYESYEPKPYKQTYQAAPIETKPTELLEDDIPDYVYESYTPYEPDIYEQDKQPHESEPQSEPQELRAQPYEPQPYVPDVQPPEPEHEVEQTEPPEEPYEPIPPEPIHVDCTPQILAALDAANNAGGVADIISYYAFRFSRQIRSFPDGWFRFYVTDEGSGDILIGMAADDDGSNWYMRFRHFVNGQAPTDTMDLLDFMER